METTVRLPLMKPVLLIPPASVRLDVGEHVVGDLADP